MDTITDKILKIQQLIDSDVNTSTISLYLDSINTLMIDLKFASTVFWVNHLSLLYCADLLNHKNYDNLINLINDNQIKFINKLNKQYNENIKYIDYAIEESDVNTKQLENILCIINFEYELMINNLSDVNKLLQFKDMFFYNNTFKIHNTKVTSGIPKFIKECFTTSKSKILYFAEKMDNFKNKFYNTVNFNPKTCRYCHHCNEFHCYRSNCYTECDYDCQCNNFYTGCSSTCIQKCNEHFDIDKCKSYYLTKTLIPKLYFVDNDDLCKIYRQNKQTHFFYFKNMFQTTINIKNIDYVDEFDIGQNLYNRFSKNKIVNYINFNKYKTNIYFDYEHATFIKMLNKSIKYLYKHCDDKINLLCIFEYIIALFHPDNCSNNIDYQINDTIVSLHKQIICELFNIIGCVVQGYIRVDPENYI
jgi:hypothetical protein